MQDYTGDPRDYVLGRSVNEFAVAVDLLTDSEEMVLALVHPLVQVYTVPTTGQLAYVGHICNFRQKVAKFISRLPTVPQDMPFVQIRPRSLGNRPSFRAPFKVNVDKLRHAFLWLKQYNPYYHDIEWLDSSAAEWEKDDIQLPIREEEEGDCGQALPVSSENFLAWIQHATNSDACGDFGFVMGKRMLSLLEKDDVGTDSFEPWNSFRGVAAEIFATSAMRAATSIRQEVVAIVLHEHGHLDIGISHDMDMKALLSQLESMPPDEWTSDYMQLRQELAAIHLDATQDEPVIHAGAVSEQPASDDVGMRADCINTIAADVTAHFGNDLAASSAVSNVAQAEVTDANDDANEAEVEDVSGQRKASKFKYPRVDPPEVEDKPSDAIREDTPGYIPSAFPKLFPHGTGDFHSARGGLGRLLKFEEWGRYVMKWHDGRFMRHTRFRYWLLDTSLRLMTPGMQRTFFRTRKAATDYTLEDLQKNDVRKNLVQQMSSATNQLPGSIGERRKMRQELEAMVHQIEAETADVGENAGAGRVPAGFCTLTCPVYKWQQLHETILKSYPSGNKNDPKFREYYEQWKLEDPGLARDAAMKKMFYELAVTNPGAVAWYCGLKLEMSVHLTKDLLTQQMQSSAVPGLDAVKNRVEAGLKAKLGSDVNLDQIPDLVHLGHVDDFYASFEWSSGGLVHAHMAYLFRLWLLSIPPCVRGKRAGSWEK